MCNLHWCYTFCIGVTLFALVLNLNCTAPSQSESSNFFMYIIMGVIIDECLTWKPHIQNLTRKISKSLGIIYKSSFCLNKNYLYQKLIT